MSTTRGVVSIVKPECLYVPQSYVMRNAVLTVLGEIVVRELSGADLDDKLKRVRDGFLDKLEVRGSSKALQIVWFVNEVLVVNRGKK